MSLLGSDMAALACCRVNFPQKNSTLRQCALQSYEEFRHAFCPRVAGLWDLASSPFLNPEKKMSAVNASLTKEDTSNVMSAREKGFN